MLSTAAIAWLPWRADSFARARAEGRPVLLSPRTHLVRQQRRDGYRDLRGSRGGRADQRALRRRSASTRTGGRISAERYSLGGWPTTAFLTPDGDVLGGGTFIERHRLADVLRRVSAVFAAGARSAPRRAARPRPRSLPERLPPLEQLIDVVDRGLRSPQHGGFGGAPKFPHAAPVRLALHLYREGGSETHRDIAITTLDAMGWGPLYDEKDGGFFRYARRADWGEPNGEKLLDVNASLLDLYIDAAEIARARALPRTGRRHPALRADMARRSGRRRMGRVAARRSRLPRG